MSSRIPAGIQASPAVLLMFERYGPVYTWFAVATAMIGSFATLLTGTIINVAIPEVMGAFGIGQDQAQWLSTGFLAAGTVTMLLAAWGTAAFGMRTTYVFSMLLFLAGSLLGGIASNPELLIISRIIQGAAAGVLSPLSMVINYQIFPARHRGLAMGIFGIGVVLAPALGPTLGGLLIDNYDWRYVFYLAVPFTMVSIPMAIMFMPEREPQTAVPPLDWVGVILSSIFLVSLLTGLTNGERDSWTSDAIVSLMATAVISMTLFVWWENRVAHPLLNLHLFTHGRFLAASVVTFILGIGLYGSTYLVPLFLQTLQHFTPTNSGLLMLPAGLAMAALFPFAGAMSDRVEPRFVIIAGLVLFAVSSWLMRLVDFDTPYAALMFWAVIGRLGLALIFPSLNAASLASLPLELLSQGSGAINFLRQLGGAFGVNLLSIFLAQRTAEYSQAFTSTQSSKPATLELLQQIQDTIFGERLGFLMQFDLSFSYLASTVYGQAMVMSFREGFLAVAIIFVIAILPAVFMRARGDQAR
jgi:MFS transporter, DHA2 family, multidrug resistance protein